MADVFIPSVSNSSVNATEQIRKVLDAKRVPLTRMEDEVEAFQNEKITWSNTRRNIIKLSESAKALYQFGNAFSERRLVSSSDAIEGNTKPNSDIGTYKISVIQIAQVDKFASTELDTKTTVSAGNYPFQLGDIKKTVVFSGGGLNDFIQTINTQVKNIIKATLISVSPDKSVFILSGKKEGREQKLVLTGITAQLAKDWQIIDENATPIHALSRAQDARISLEGIEISNPRNTIENIIPGITLKLKDVTKKPETISVSPNTDFSKEQIINFVGNYNILMQKINILTSNRETIIDEIDFPSIEERTQAKQQLGKLQGNSQLNRLRFTLQSITTGFIRIAGKSHTLEEIGISSQAQGGSTTAAQRRGYLEIDEAKLDKQLQNNLEMVAKFFGNDRNHDLIIDGGIAFQVETTLQPYLQNNGVIKNRLKTIDMLITDKQKQINTYSKKLDDLETQLKREFAILDQQVRALEENTKALDSFIGRKK